jgi:hypothetical protein
VQGCTRAGKGQAQANDDPLISLSCRFYFEGPMPKLTWNKFLDTHKKGVCIDFVFVDYARMQREMRSARKKGARVIQAGKILPRPNTLVSALAARRVSGSYTIKARGVL